MVGGGGRGAASSKTLPCDWSAVLMTSHTVYISDGVSERVFFQMPQLNFVISLVINLFTVKKIFTHKMEINIGEPSINYLLYIVTHTELLLMKHYCVHNL